MTANIDKIIMNMMAGELPRVESFNYNKHLPQSSAAKTNDLFFILCSLYIADREQKAITQLVLEKALFKTSQELAHEKISFLNTFFFINKLGPHNNIFYSYLGELEEAGLINKEDRNISLTSKGLSVSSQMIEDISEDSKLLHILESLQSKIEYCSTHVTRSIDEIHEQQVIDTTDQNKVKTINEIIKQDRPELLFKKGSQFKYIDPFVEPNPQKIPIPPTVLNNLENILAKVDDIDFEQVASLGPLFT